MGDLERQLVADPRWRWEPGMVYAENATPGAGLCRDGRGRVQDTWDAVPHAATPDLSDPATAGILLSWMQRGYTVVDYHTGEVEIHPRIGLRFHVGRSLGEAVALALLALPPETPWGGERG